MQNVSYNKAAERQHINNRTVAEANNQLEKVQRHLNSLSKCNSIQFDVNGTGSVVKIEMCSFSIVLCGLAVRLCVCMYR